MSELDTAGGGVKILHISDTHGGMPALPAEDFDAIVHSGDLLPNRSFGIATVERTFQPYWVEDNAKRFKAWLGDRPFLFTPGNHDYIDPTPLLRDAGVDAHLLCNGLLDVDGVSFYGHPWTPEFCGWNWMCGPTAMRQHLAPAIELMEQGGIDVFVSHGPIHGVLDRNSSGERCGSRVVRDVLQLVRHPPRLFLCGHIHEAAGVQGWSRGMVVSNAATTQRILAVAA